MDRSDKLLAWPGLTLIALAIGEIVGYSTWTVVLFAVGITMFAVWMVITMRQLNQGKREIESWLDDQENPR